VIKGIPLAMIAVGGVLVYSGIENSPVTAIFRSLSTGKPPAKGAAETFATTGDTTGTTPPAGDQGAATADASQAQGIARVLAAPYGWATGQEFADLVSLWNRESGWNRLADNPSSGAYGIPQSLPGSKMGTLANPPTSSATAQIAWGLSYIKSTYGSPSAAWAHETSQGWY
jgi:hypothetical protein